jgi:hypothetical protein
LTIDLPVVGASVRDQPCTTRCIAHNGSPTSSSRRARDRVSFRALATCIVPLVSLALAFAPAASADGPVQGLLGAVSADTTHVVSTATSSVTQQTPPAESTSAPQSSQPQLVSASVEHAVASVVPQASATLAPALESPSAVAEHTAPRRLNEATAKSVYRLLARPRTAAPDARSQLAKATTTLERAAPPAPSAAKEPQPQPYELALATDVARRASSSPPPRHTKALLKALPVFSTAAGSMLHEPVARTPTLATAATQAMAMLERQVLTPLGETLTGAVRVPLGALFESELGALPGPTGALASISEALTPRLRSLLGEVLPLDQASNVTAPTLSASASSSDLAEESGTASSGEVTTRSARGSRRTPTLGSLDRSLAHAAAPARSLHASSSPHRLAPIRAQSPLAALGSGTGALGAGGGFGISLTLALVALTALAVLSARRLLRPAADRRLLAAFALIAERPG